MATSSSETGAAEEPTSTKAEAGENHSLTLLTSDGEKFVVPKSAALQSIKVKNMVNDGCADGIIPLPDVNARTLSKIMPYLMKHANESLSSDDLKKFDEEFLADVESLNDLRNCMSAANYLEITTLVVVLLGQITNFIDKKMPLAECVEDLFLVFEEFEEKYGLGDDDDDEEEEEEEPAAAAAA